MKHKPKVVLKKWPDDIEFPFGSAPVVRLEDWRTDQVIPFPCYAHSLDVVRDTLDICTDAYEPVTPLTVFVGEFETEGQTNGWASRRDHYYYDEEDEEVKAQKRKELPWNAMIWLLGKRTPLHPAMTRFVTAHEYGHQVEDWIAHLRACESGNDIHTEETALKKEYQEIRGCKEERSYGGRTWHTATGEIFADDFRHVIGVELEHWPHPGIKRPEQEPGVMDFWMKYLR